MFRLLASLSCFKCRVQWVYFANFKKSDWAMIIMPKL